MRLTSRFCQFHQLICLFKICVPEDSNGSSVAGIMNFRCSKIVAEAGAAASVVGSTVLVEVDTTAAVEALTFLVVVVAVVVVATVVMVVTVVAVEVVEVVVVVVAVFVVVEVGADSSQVTSPVMQVVQLSSRCEQLWYKRQAVDLQHCLRTSYHACSRTIMFYQLL